ncbi:MAG: hypothetical protein PVG65_03340 [Candidatus Thorarchaeota archaeon]
MSNKSPYNQVDDQSSLDEFKRLFSLSINTLQEATQRGGDPFYLNLLTDLEGIKEHLEAYENDELELLIEEAFEEDQELLQRLATGDIPKHEILVGILKDIDLNADDPCAGGPAWIIALVDEDNNIVHIIDGDGLAVLDKYKNKRIRILIEEFD